ncbi:sensor histidine kinase [Pseudomonas sp. R5(2019)]|uniref:sensor histidine kinase n=1 Tax=Pseudomonas sp. R5(2019) TaxID=2697566 RepID=UPI0014127616|nr:sensor histidine kinase [Pseudomonas sp. R5(2019)]NBA93809.1 sensor histidine kinase [Pseudomonas sp. R5(2019)]
MFASLKTLKLCSPGLSPARWLTVVLCVAAGIGNSGLYIAARPMSLTLLLVNLGALLAAGWCIQRTLKYLQIPAHELAERLLKVQQNERHRLSRELHDDIGQLLTAAKLQADWLQRRAPAELQEHCTLLRNTLDETLSSVRDVTVVLNPRQLTRLGLEASLRAHLLRTLHNTPVRWSLDCQQRLDSLPEELSVAVFRITQEAVTNVLRHARADNLRICLQRTSEGLIVHIEDDGQGFVPAADPGLAGQRGMSGMLERTGLLGATLTVNSEPGNGTRIEAMFPWEPRTFERAKAGKRP